MRAFNWEEVLDRLEVDEGFSRTPYLDSKGFETIGHGILIDPRRGGGIEEEESRWILKNRMLKRLQMLRDRFVWFKKIDPVRQQVIACMSWQLGVNGVANFKKMCTALSALDYERAADEMLDSEWYRKDSKLRAQRLADIMRSGDWHVGKNSET